MGKNKAKKRRLTNRIKKNRSRSKEVDANINGVPEQEKKVFIEKLLDRAESCISSFEYELAQKFLEKALLYEPNNVTALDGLAGVLLEIGNTDEAKETLLKAIQLCPDSRHNIYFSLAQLNEGQDALEYYRKGIDIIESSFADKEELEKNEDENSLKKDLSSAYCSVAEIYMTDCCFEDCAEEQCMININKSIACDPSNPEGYQCLSNYLLMKGDEEEAKSAITKSLSLWLPQMQAAAEGETEETCSLNYISRINTSKLLIELKMFDEASEVLDGLIDEMDEVVEVWYLLGWLNYLRGQDYWGNARYYLQKAKKVENKVQQGDPDQIAHADELLSEIGPGSDDEVSKTDEDKENEVMDDDIDYFDSESDESMEH